MQSTDPHFIQFTQSVDAMALPHKFTFPFYYQPHPICELAAQQLQNKLDQPDFLTHDFSETGKMFGVLLVKNSDDQLGFLAGYSGKLSQEPQTQLFVPPVFDAFTGETFVVKEMAIIGEINNEINTLKHNPQLSLLKQQLSDAQTEYEQALNVQYDTMAINRLERKTHRAKLSVSPSANDESMLQTLATQSIEDKRELKRIKDIWQQKINSLEHALAILNSQLDELAKTRRKLSAKLQRKLFAQYAFINGKNQTRDLNDIFKAQDIALPPSGAGECAAPKLLQYAFLNGYKPLALAEFWWGAAPKSEVRQHKNYYPACQSKCLPILTHMLEGLLVDDNPLLINPAQGRELEIIYQDEHMLVINKPHDFLSVPGTHIKDSVFTRLKKQFPQATGPLIVHRLDMATSGLMLIALTPRANKSLAKQFATREIDKKYIALLDGHLTEKHGTIALPLRGDIEDRPRQLVCFEHGKPALTTWTLLEHKAGKSKVLLSPKTGRTHQLRVHCAHAQGLNTSIVGDTLYGTKSKRLHLHAGEICFTHPITKERLTFKVEADF